MESLTLYGSDEEEEVVWEVGSQRRPWPLSDKENKLAR